MAKKSVVKLVQGNGTWTSKRDGKIFYKYSVIMENGDTGEYSSVSETQDKFVEGTEVEYEFIDGDFPKIKPHYTYNSTQSGNYKIDLEKDENIARAVALKTAARFAIANKSSLDDLFTIADRMNNYLTNSDTVTKIDEEDPF